MKTKEEILKQYETFVVLSQPHNTTPIFLAENVYLAMDEYATQQLEAEREKRITDKEIEEYIWEEISVPLSKIDIDTHSDGYIQYLNAVHWAKWGRDNSKGL